MIVRWLLRIGCGRWASLLRFCVWRVYQTLLWPASFSAGPQNEKISWHASEQSGAFKVVSLHPSKWPPPKRRRWTSKVPIAFLDLLSCFALSALVLLYNADWAVFSSHTFYLLCPGNYSTVTVFIMNPQPPRRWGRINTPSLWNAPELDFFKTRPNT